ncbi:uncharacterized protein N0V89_007816 [Didymosphaeria variabile]|uniref:HTH La-type RNA-binding domain-containing protein n=1 Tax=Didymosphaeria variabile TaxID=1932322 RepID=A0A9W8XJK2_9PLEO|nr:uncharacterized protein N0V89_007816 [Didymosphaeria variabile]KAJ4352468.1 hypothetical protein N0V89_007816 [Didymosphaeria variabile]
MAATTEPATVPEEHPDAPEIRRQVEYYFSDENLPIDLHLLQCCGGRENQPVSISRICGFKKMRGFKPKSMVPAALRKSAFLVVSEDGKQVSRKVALRGPCALDPDYFKDDEIAYDPRARVPAVQPVPLLPQTKAEYPEGKSKNMMKPTGFEHTYVEPPITPDEAQEEDAMYDPDKHFVERIEIAIQRFKQKRRMHEQYSNIFNKWMRFGGVDSAPRMSSFFPAHYGFNPHQIKTACQVLRSFYNYLIYHSVCPEYRDDLDKARKLCDTAEIELSKSYNAGLALPGAFNTAASTIFGGSKAGTYTGNVEWAIKLKEEGVDLQETSSKPCSTKAVKVLRDESFSLEVVTISPSDQLTREMYARQNGFTASKLQLQPLGTLVCRSFYLDDFNEYDLPKNKYSNGRLSKSEDGKQYEFWIEDRVLEECFVGMKLDARILTLAGGITILDDVREAMCSFYKWLPNELWMHRHPKEVVIRKKDLDEESEADVEDGEGGESKFADDESVYGE